MLERREHMRITAGPFPDPQTLSAYKELHPEFPERLFAFTEREQAHRHELERQLVNGELEDMRAERLAEKRGQGYALAVCIVGFACAAIIAIMGSPGWASAVAGGSLAGIVGVFITRKTTARDAPGNADPPP